MGATRNRGPDDLVAAARAAGVRDRRVLAAMRATRREDFVPAGRRDVAYTDRPVPISHGQVTTQPSLQAMMLAALELAGGESVLEIGTGYGYQTALLARLAARVVSVELWPDMAEHARRNLAGLGVGGGGAAAGRAAHRRRPPGPARRPRRRRGRGAAPAGR